MGVYHSFIGFKSIAFFCHLDRLGEESNFYKRLSRSSVSETASRNWEFSLFKCKLNVLYKLSSIVGGY